MLNWHSFQESDKNIAWWCWMDSYSLWLDLYICLTQRLVCDLLPIFPRDVLASSSADLHYLYMIFFFRLMIVSPKFIILVFTWNEMEDSSCIIYCGSKLNICPFCLVLPETLHDQTFWARGIYYSQGQIQALCCADERWEKLVAAKFLTIKCKFAWIMSENKVLELKILQ